MAGSVDFDVLDAINEFQWGSLEVGLPFSSGIETRIYLSQFSDLEFSSPNEPGVAYYMGNGFTRLPEKGSEAENVLSFLKQVAQKRNLKIIEKDKQNQIIALEKVGLDESYLKLKIYELSGGQAQRVAIARMLLKNLKIILADEPTGALDDQTGEQVGKLLLSLVTADTTLIVATHDLALANQMDTIIYMKDLRK